MVRAARVTGDVCWMRRQGAPSAVWLGVSRLSVPEGSSPNCQDENGNPFYEVVDAPGDDEVTELESN